MDEVTIVIKCKSDSHVLETIRSVDRPAEVIVALVPDPDLKEHIEAQGVRVVDAPDDNAGASCQRGLLAATSEACILTDSDTVFGPGYIQACLDALREHDICRGRIRILHDPLIKGSCAVSRVRDYFNNVRRPPYMPGLGVRRSFAMRLGGFDEDIRWGVDYEFGTRVAAVGARYAYLESVYIDHLPVSPDHDLRAAFRTGQAMRTLDRKTGKPGGPLNGWVRSTLTSVFHEPYLDLVRRGGLAAGWHHLRWVRSFHRGYWSARRS